jgi:hypothetical protein
VGIIGKVSATVTVILAEAAWTVLQEVNRALQHT